MKIIFIGYWSVYDGLSIATIKPHLEILSSLDVIESIIYVSIEREHDHVRCNWNIEKLEFLPYYSPPSFFFLDKVREFFQLPRLITKICKSHKNFKIICRGAPAGAIGYQVWRRTGTKYYVESFEPHSEYMLATGVWSYWDIRYHIQRFYERKQRKTASILFTVSLNFKNYLNDIENIQTAYALPCVVDLKSFEFSTNSRHEIRQRYGLHQDRVVGIYVGKFGGLYYENESFRLFRSMMDLIPDLFIFILTPQHNEYITDKLSEFGVAAENVWFGKVRYNEVAWYLSASDMAFSLHKSTKWSFAFSPIKNGEYWANGLPILSPNSIGDDSDIITEKGGGIIIDLESGISDYQVLQLQNLIKMLNADRHDNLCVHHARIFRGGQHLLKAYEKMVND